jgi:hypothetical protein
MPGNIVLAQVLGAVAVELGATVEIARPAVARNRNRSPITAAVRAGRRGRDRGHRAGPCSLLGHHRGRRGLGAGPRVRRCSCAWRGRGHHCGRAPALLGGPALRWRARARPGLDAGASPRPRRWPGARRSPRRVPLRCSAGRSGPRARRWRRARSWAGWPGLDAHRGLGGHRALTAGSAGIERSPRPALLGGLARRWPGAVACPWRDHRGRSWPLDAALASFIFSK